MKSKRKNKFTRFLKKSNFNFLFLFLIFLSFAVIFSEVIFADFVGPSSNPPSGNGPLQTDGNRNFGIVGTSSEITPSQGSFGKVFTVSSSSAPGFSLYKPSSLKRFTWYLDSSDVLSLWYNTQSGGSNKLGVSSAGALNIYGPIYSANDPNYYLDPGGAVNPYSGLFKNNVGIGTTAPGSPLTVYGASSANAVFTVGAGSGLSTDKIFRILTDTSPVVEGVTVLRNGNVGIGTTNPGQPLDVQTSNDNTYISISSGSTGGSYSGFAAERNVGYGYFRVRNDGGDPSVEIRTVGKSSYKPDLRFIVQDAGEVMRIETNGNVGIGTTTPGYKLDVVGGSTRLDQWLAVGGATPGGVGGTSGYGITLPATTNDFVKIFGEHNGVDTSDGIFLTGDNTTDGWKFRESDCCGAGTLDYIVIRRATPQITIYSTSTDASSISVTNGFTSFNSSGNNPGYSFMGGNIGIGTTTPATKLHLYDSSSGPIITLSGSNSNYRGLTIKDTAGSEQWFYGPNNSNNFVVRRSGSSDYITVSSSTGKVTLSGGMKIQSGATLDMTDSSNAINMAGGNIYQVGKLTAASIDPLYNIEGKNYSTYVSSIAGPIKEEYVGKGRAALFKDNFYEFVLDFNSVEYGSALWVWRKVVDFNKENVDVFITPIGKPDLVSYEVKENSIIFRSKSPAEFSYRLVGNRFDWGSWPVLSKDQSEKPSFVIH